VTAFHMEGMSRIATLHEHETTALLFKEYSEAVSSASQTRLGKYSLRTYKEGWLSADCV
jgi:hypothetical protein